MTSRKQFKAQFKRDATTKQRAQADPYRGRRLPLTSRLATVEEVPDFDKDRISSIRTSLNLSQPLFAAALNVSSETIKAWEQGKRVPDGAALRLLQLAEQRPEWILETVRINRRTTAVGDVDQDGPSDTAGSR